MPITPDQHTDPIFLGVGIAICLVVAALFFKHERELKRKRDHEARQSKMFDDIEVKANYIKTKIRACWDEDELNTWLGHIVQFKHDYHYYLNSKYYDKILDDVYEQQKTNIYREQ